MNVTLVLAVVCQAVQLSASIFTLGKCILQPKLGSQLEKLWPGNLFGNSEFNYGFFEVVGMIMPAVVFCIAGWEELQTARYKFGGNIIVFEYTKVEEYFF